MAKHLPPLSPVSSTALKGRHYDPESRTLTLQFASGEVWEYDNVPMERAEALAGAASPGSFFHKRIRGQYNGRKL